MNDHRLQEIMGEFSDYGRDTKLGAIYGTPTNGEFLDIIQDALRYRYLRDHCGGGYPMADDSSTPAELFIQWDWQQAIPTDATATIDEVIDREIKCKDAEEAEEAA